ncbi:MAG: Neutral ceramidase [Paenibacillus sp.]|nr:Neutral ceramidase [Paenibacillus sp.]
MVHCGMSEVVITPPLGSSIPGYLDERKSTHIIDELYAKAIVADTGDGLLAMVVVDALYLRQIEVERIRERIQLFVPITADRIMISATHTHTGPPIRHGFDDSLNQSYLDYMVDRTADAVIQAYVQRQPARIGSGRGYEPDIAFNRRFFMKDGSVQTNPGCQNPEIDRPTGPTDPEVLVVRIDDEAGQPIGVITNFACHTDTVGGLGTSADFPGELSRSLKESLGSQVISLFVLGACGNINHVDVTKPRTSIQKKHYIKMGRILAGEVLKVREKITPAEANVDMQQAALQTFFPIEYRRPTPEASEQARQLIASGASAGRDRFFAEQLLLVNDNPQHIAEIEVQAFRLGELAIVGLPGEIFVEFGLKLKADSPFPYTMVNTLCNSSTIGYVCTKEAYEQGGYEPKLRNSHRNPPGAGDLFIEKAAGLLREMQG